MVQNAIFAKARSWFEEPSSVDASPIDGDLCPYLGGRITLDELSDEVRPGVVRLGANRVLSVDGIAEDLEAVASAQGTLADLEVPGNPKLSEIVTRIRRWGVAVLPGIVPPALLAGLESEFARMIEGRAQLAKKFRVDEASDSICVRLVRDKLDAQSFPEIARFFASPVMRKIADATFGDSSYQFNHQIFVHQTEPTVSPPSGDLHFDVTRMLKFWLYLSDGSEANGAMRAVPGTNLWLRLVRREYSDRLVPKSQIQNTVDPAPLQPIPIAGPAGTLFVFDTDVAHGASVVAAGGQRRIMRGHCIEDLFAQRARLRGQ